MLRAGFRAIEDGVTSIETHFILQLYSALRTMVISRISHPAISLHQRRGTEVLILIPPVAGATSRAASTENTFIKTVEFLALFW